MAKHHAGQETGSSDELLSFLRRSDWMRALSPQLAKLVEDSTKLRQISSGEYVYRVGDKPKSWIGVVDGLMEMCLTSAVGKITAVAAVADGDWIGEASLVSGKNRRFDLLAMRETHVACVPRETFLRLYGDSIPFNHFLVQKLARRTGQMALALSDERSLTKKERLATCLWRMLSGQITEKTASIRMSQEEIGLLAGLSRQQTNVALKELESDGLVTVHHGGLCILNVEGLSKLSR